MRGALLAALVAIGHSDAQFQVPIFSDLQAGHFDTKDQTHVYAHHGHDHTHDHDEEHHPYHSADDDAVPHPHNYIPIPIIRDCNGDFGPEPKKCVCNAAEIGFAQNTCEAGQACYSDGGCRDMQQVRCNVYENTGGMTTISATYNGAEVFADGDGFFDFEDAGPQASFFVAVEFEDRQRSNPSGILNCSDAYARVKCTAATGPYMSIDTGLRMGELWGDELPVSHAGCEATEGSNFSVVTGSIRIQPYIPAAAGSCARASSESQCNGMRAIGARCCYDYASARCTYDEQCYYKAGPVAVTSRDFASEIFGERVVTVRSSGHPDWHGDNHNANDGTEHNDDDDTNDPLLGLARTLANLVN